MLIFLLAILILVCASTSLAFRTMYSAYKLNKQGNYLVSLPKIFSRCLVDFKVRCNLNKAFKDLHSLVSTLLYYASVLPFPKAKSLLYKSLLPGYYSACFYASALCSSSNFACQNPTNPLNSSGIIN